MSTNAPEESKGTDFSTVEAEITACIRGAHEHQRRITHEIDKQQAKHEVVGEYRNKFEDLLARLKSKSSPQANLPR